MPAPPPSETAAQVELSGFSFLGNPPVLYDLKCRKVVLYPSKRQKKVDKSTSRSIIVFTNERVKTFMYFYEQR